MTPEEQERAALYESLIRARAERRELATAAYDLLAVLLPMRVPIAHRAEVRAAVQKLRAKL